jgi:RNase P/RNase MRP subunit POP5
MKHVSRYYAVLGKCKVNDCINEARRMMVSLVGIEGSASLQLFLIKETEWGFVVRMRDYDGRNARALPFVFSMVRADKGFLQCFAISGTLRALSAKLKEKGLVF